MKNDDNNLLDAARMVDRLAFDNPGVGIPVDPDVADYMGALQLEGDVPEEFLEEQSEDYE